MRVFRPLLPLIGVTLLMMAAVACGSAATATPTATLPPTATSTATPTPTVQPLSVTLPQDDASHKNLLEWWYFNGHLQGSEDAKYGYHFVFFEGYSVSLETYFLLGQLGISDHQTETFAFTQRIGSRMEVGERGFDITVDDWHMSGFAGEFKLTASLEDYTIDLELSAAKPAAVHDGDGLVDLGDAGKSYYYSYPRIETRGTVTDHGKEVQVDGVSWMDHQWGDFSIAEIGWDWFSLQLDDGVEIMYYVIRDRGGAVTNRFGTLVDAQGNTSPLDASVVTLRALDTWLSPITNAEYPVAWEMEIESLGLFLRLDPVLPDAELYTANPSVPTYWEGEVVIQGQRDGTAIGGLGFVELVGYDKR